MKRTFLHAGNTALLVWWPRCALGPEASPWQRGAPRRERRLTCEVIWEPEALAQAERLAKDDPATVRQVCTAVDRLADDPRPDGAFGAGDVLRVHVRPYRVVYEDSDRHIRVNVIHLGRVR
ncbi:type II toxin-antitoxin system RelE/ParE family toxin [Streptomyces sp. MRC013]|uniref:type II toxin-antitoxin system RelE family toxin n=1 Tax=Streptomyces sp. MRC013 TaxID=2898276 RepID=UPI002025C5DC|nr:type II toxin-antitoxin system RelE/ParE family toxin [Streptomyces sp. MRC013]URM91160.1 type II toxin-antitoxin system RelE/ParE family toxin [Streptomyces sp. MRC013]